MSAFRLVALARAVHVFRNYARLGIGIATVGFCALVAAAAIRLVIPLWRSGSPVGVIDHGRSLPAQSEA